MDSTLSTNLASTEVLAPCQALCPSFMTKSSHVYLQFVTIAEADQIHAQFINVGFEPGRQVMWTGVPRDRVQKWADANGMQTLTSVMGPLMNKEHPSCLKVKKSPKEWSTYVKGASALFALHVPKGDVVTIITRPPPQTYNPTGNSTYQTIEEPILKGKEGSEAVSCINMLHLTVTGAENHRYQVWPVDQTCSWTETFGTHLSKVLVITGGGKGKPEKQKGLREQNEKYKNEQGQEEGREQFAKGKEEKNKKYDQERAEEEDRKKIERKETEKNKKLLKEKRKREKIQEDKKEIEQKEERKKITSENQAREKAIKEKNKMDNKRKVTEQEGRKEESERKKKEKRKREDTMRKQRKPENERNKGREKAAKGEQETRQVKSLRQQMKSKAEGEEEKVTCTEEASRSYEGTSEHGEGRHSGSKDIQPAELTSKQVRKGLAFQSHVDVSLRVPAILNDGLTGAQETSAYSRIIPVEAQIAETDATNEIGQDEHPHLLRAYRFSNGSDLRHRDANNIVLLRKPRILVLRSRAVTFQ